MAYQNTTFQDKGKTLTINELHLSQENRLKINQLIEEFRYLEALKKYNISFDNKVLLYGKTGCGKTATAKAIGKALHKEVIILNLGGFVSSRLGETGKNITEVFRKVSYSNAILFIDEFDFIGKIRDYDNKDSGEMKRLVNTLIQQIDNLSNTSLLICATNHIEIIDTALLRRFQMKLKYELPKSKELDDYYDSVLGSFPKNINQIKRIYDVSYAEAKDISYKQVKSNIIQLEKQKKQLLFSYGILQQNELQIEIYERKLSGMEDVLEGYKLEDIQIKDKTVTQKNNKEHYPIAIKTNNKEHCIKGKIFQITTDELFKTDVYEVEGYKRVLETFKSGKEAWVYVKM